MKAPFPYFGGKSKVAPIVWDALGQPKHYIEPFFGSGAVLLNRPRYDPAKHIETVNDKDGFIANTWRALQAAPDDVAKWCDWPVNHADLCARRRALIAAEGRLLSELIADDEFYDAKMAGYWIWAASCWIGSGLTKLKARPDIAGSGKGVHAIGKRPHSNAGMGVHGTYNPNIYTWFRELSERLRRVRVVCGDWRRVCGGDWQDKMGTVGIFFDPPYGDVGRDKKLYHHDSVDIADEVRAWCLERGDRPTYRIVLAGYDEHEDLLSRGWRAERWKAQGGYSNIGKGKNGNRHREVLYLSPHCLNGSGEFVEAYKPFAGKREEE